MFFLALLMFLITFVVVTVTTGTEKFPFNMQNVL